MTPGSTRRCRHVPPDRLVIIGYTGDATIEFLGVSGARGAPNIVFAQHLNTQGKITGVPTDFFDWKHSQ
jgi:hypothetical protein